MFVEVIVAVGESKSTVRSAEFYFNGGVTSEYSGCYVTYV